MPAVCTRAPTAADPLGAVVPYAPAPGGFAGVLEFTRFEAADTSPGVAIDHAYILAPNTSALLSLPAIVSLASNAIRAAEAGTSSSSSINARFQALPELPKSEARPAPVPLLCVSVCASFHS